MLTQLQDHKVEVTPHSYITSNTEKFELADLHT